MLSKPKTMNRITFLLTLFAFFYSCEEPSNTNEPDPEFNRDDVRLLYSRNPNGHNELYKLENGKDTEILSEPCRNENDFYGFGCGRK